MTIGPIIWPPEPIVELPTPLSLMPLESNLSLVNGFGTATFDRFTVGTAYGSDGLLQVMAIDVPRFEYEIVTQAATNEVLWSEDFTNAAWVQTRTTVTGNVVTAPDGTLTGDKFIATAVSGNHYSLQTSVKPALAMKYTYSAYFSAAEYDIVELWLTGTSVNDNCLVRFDLGTQQVVSTTSLGTFSLPSGSITLDQNGFFRCSVTGKTDTGTIVTGLQKLVNNSGEASFTGDGVSGIYEWGGQLETGDLSAYIKTTTAEVTVPLTTAPIGILIEDGDSNKFLQSGDLNNVAWVVLNTAKTANAAAGPDGTTTMTLLTPSSTSGSHHVSQSTALNNALKYTQSVYVRAGGNDFFQMAGATGFAPTSWANFDLYNGTVASTGSTGTATIEEITTGLFRCSVTFITTSSTTGEILMTGLPSDLASNSPSFTGDDVSGVYLWGGQIENKPFMTSYIPSTTAATSRGRDNLSILPTNIPLSDEPFTVSAFVDIKGILTVDSPSQHQPVFWVSGETTRTMEAQAVATRSFLPEFVNNGGFAQAAAELIPLKTTRMVATSNPAGNVELHIDDFETSGLYKGGATGTATDIAIGHTTGGFNSSLYGHIRSFRIDSVVLTHGQIQLL